MSFTKLEEDLQPMIGSLGRPIFVHKNQLNNNNYNWHLKFVSIQTKEKILSI